ncbi:glycoside hydrolase family protein [Sphingomonas sp. PB4P5]|uniref:glycoside hydrolase family protein n=1 Tax=Parasphingomonas puruogangriensis TaxID=3096155 RepID=UPI002FCB5B1D
MQMLRVGSRGDEVRTLQNLLRRYDPQLASDGVFGPQTERAVRLSQRRNGLYPPDGIAGPMTMGALNGAGIGAPTRSVPIPTARSAAVRSANAAATATARPVAPGRGDAGPLKAAVDPARERARTAPMPAGVVAPVAGMHMSRLGRRFIYDHEAQHGVSNRLHHPSSGSGVTIGPGYDMKDRSAASVQADLQAVQVPPAAAAQAAKGAGLSGTAAHNFVRDNKTVLNLTREQQEALLVHILPSYEARVKRAITIQLHQNEFDALVSYAYNPGGGWKKTTKLVNESKPHDAMVEIKRHVYSKGERINSLVVRRAAESKMFLYGEYK